MAATKEKRLEPSRVVYMQTALYARKHGELDLYRQSNQKNKDCKDAIEGYISSHYKDNILNMDGVSDLVDEYGTQRMAYVLANTLRHKNHDGRFSHSNKRWAETIQMPFTDDNSIAGDNSLFWTVQSHPGLLNMFINTVRDIITAKVQETAGSPVADDITDLRLLRYNFDHGEGEYVFSCMNRGEPDTLTYLTTRHDDGQGFIFYTQKDNIWDRMDASECRKLRAVLERDANFGMFEREIDSSKTASDLEFAEMAIMEADSEILSMEQWDLLGDMIDKKREELSNIPENGKQEDNPSKAQDSINQKATKLKQPKM